MDKTKWIESNLNILRKRGVVKPSNEADWKERLSASYDRIDWDAPPEDHPATEEWIPTADFSAALLKLPEEVRSGMMAKAEELLAFSIQVPPDYVNLLDPRVEMFLASAGVTLEQFKGLID